MRRDSGFTIIGLMIAIGIIAITIAVAVPNIIGWLPNYRLKSAARDLLSNFQRAKIEAVKRYRNVVIIFVPGPYQAGGGIGSYQVFVDNPPNNGVFDPGEFVLAQVTMPKNVSLYLTTFGGNTTGYTPRGLPWSNRWGAVEIQNNNSRFYRASLSSAGYVRLQTSNDGSTWTSI